MTYLLLFAIANVVFFNHLEKKKLQVATILHAVFFFYVSLAYVILIDDPLINEMLFRWISPFALSAIRTAIATFFVLPNLSAVLFLEALSVVLIIIASVICLQHFISASKKTKSNVIKGFKHSPKFFYPASKPCSSLKIYRKNCVMRC